MMDEGAGRILIVAGEASADAHGAALVRELKKARPGLEVFGLGGERLAEAGADLILDLTRAGVVGITELIPQVPTYWAAYRRLMAEVENHPPRGAILLDLPDFNLFLAGRIRRRSPSTRLIYYISPQVWAWRSGRVKKMARLLDSMLVLFPFEEPIYREAGLDVEFVGHPLVDTVRPSADRSSLRRDFAVEGDGPVVALMPGSRRAEIERCLPVMAEAVRRLSADGVRFLLARAPSVAESFIAHGLGDAREQVRIVADRTYDVLAAADAAVVKSGTSTLETTLLQVPMVVVGAVSWFSYQVGIRLVTARHYSLPNVIAGRELVRELIQHELTAEALVAEVRSLLFDAARRERMKAELGEVKAALGEGGASARAARAVERRLWADSPSIG